MYGRFSYDWRRSSITVWRWFSKFSRVTLSERMRSASRKSPSSSELAGSVSK